MAVTSLYRSLMCQVAGAIRRKRWTMQVCDDKSGVQDGYTAKMLHPDTPSGRQARWETVQLLIDALYPAGVDLVLVPRRPSGRPQAQSPVQLDLPLDRAA